MEASQVELLCEDELSDHLLVVLALSVHRGHWNRLQFKLLRGKVKSNGSCKSLGIFVIVKTTPPKKLNAKVEYLNPLVPRVQKIKICKQALTVFHWLNL